MAEETVERLGLLAAFQEGRAERRTWSGLSLKESYGPEDLAGQDYAGDVGAVGEYPFTRGIYRTMYGGKYWTRRQQAGFGSPADTNKRLHYYVKTGLTGLNTLSDQPTSAGIDADHPRAAGAIGVAGVSVSSMLDVETITDGLALDQISWAWQVGGASGPATLAAYVATARKRGLDPRILKVTFLNDPLQLYWCGYLPDGTAALDLILKLGTDITEYCAREMPRAYATYVDSYNIRELGVGAVEEAAWCLAKGILYVQRAVERGLAVDDFAPRLSFFCSAHIDFFEEIAKLRAMRRMWARIMKERFGAQNPRSQQFRFAVETAGSSLTHEQPFNNIMRTTVQLLAAVLGGAQAATPACYDEAVCVPSEQAATISIRTQQILAYETGVASVGDPLGGSYFVESLTNQLEAEITKLLRRIEERGGILEATKSGWFDREWEQGAFRNREKVENGERIVVGVNAFVVPEETTPCEVFRPPEESAREQIAAVRALKASRDQAAVRAALARLRERAQEGVNLIPAYVEAAEAYATIGEMNGTVREAFGLPYDPFGDIQNPFGETRAA